MFDYYCNTRENCKNSSSTFVRAYMDCKFGDILIEYDYDMGYRRVSIAIMNSDNIKIDCVSINEVFIQAKDIINRLRKLTKDYNVISINEIKEYLHMSNSKYAELYGVIL